MQGTGAGIHGNAILCAAIACEFLLKRQYFATQNKLTRLQDLGDGRVDLWLDVLVLDFQIERGNFKRCHECLFDNSFPAYQRTRERSRNSGKITKQIEFKTEHSSREVPIESRASVIYYGRPDPQRHGTHHH